MPTRAPFIPPSYRPARPLSIALAALLLAQASLAAPSDDDPADVPFSGCTFEGVRFPLGPQRLDLTLSADRAFAWTEGDTRRGVLDRDVSVILGPHTFRAARAAVWIEPLSIDDDDADEAPAPPARQVA